MSKNDNKAHADKYHSFTKKLGSNSGGKTNYGGGKTLPVEKASPKTKHGA